MYWRRLSFLSLLCGLVLRGASGDALALALPPSEGEIVGKVVDKSTGAPIEYAAVRVFSRADSTLAGGGATDDTGWFKVAKLGEGDYYLLVDVLGYEKHKIDAIRLVAGKRLDLGVIRLQADTKLLDEVEVTSEYNNVEYRVDRKVISVDKQLAASVGSAADVLANTPSIRTDIDGNILLKGSSEFIVMVDGKPTSLTATDALRQIPASTILNIEIMTNPSVKYAPDGVGGIVNIITKKNYTIGLSGVVNARAASFWSYGGDVLINYKRRTSNFYIGADYDQSIRPTQVNLRWTTKQMEDPSVSILRTGRGINERRGPRWSVRAGWDWDFTPKNSLSLSANLGIFNMQNTAGLHYSYDTIRTQAPQSAAQSITQVANQSSIRRAEYIDATVSYKHQFAQQGEELSAQVNYRGRNGSETSGNSLDESGATVNRSSYSEVGPSQDIEARVDYMRPFGENYRLEVGSHLRLEDNFNTNNMHLYYEQATPQNQSLVNRKLSFHQYIYGFYATFSGQYKALEYQAGVRGEYTDRYVRSITNSQDTTFTIGVMNFFPSVHITYSFPEGSQLLFSYTRRIERPRLWELEPFVTWIDLFNARKGNPGLQPVYLDAMELAYSKSWKKHTLEGGVYYVATSNVVERIVSSYSDLEKDDTAPMAGDNSVVLSQPNNYGRNYFIGPWVSYNVRIFKWWEASVVLNTYHLRVLGRAAGVSFDRASFNTEIDASATFNPYKTLKIRVDCKYISPSVAPQGRERGYYTIGLALQADFLKKSLTTSFRVQDIFASGLQVSIAQTRDLDSYRSRLFSAPYFSFSVGYRFNRYKEDPRRKSGSGLDGGDTSF